MTLPERRKPSLFEKAVMLLPSPLANGVMDLVAKTIDPLANDQETCVGKSTRIDWAYTPFEKSGIRHLIYRECILYLIDELKKEKLILPTKLTFDSGFDISFDINKKWGLSLVINNRHRRIELEELNIGSACLVSLRVALAHDLGTQVENQTLQYFTTFMPENHLFIYDPEYVITKYKDWIDLCLIEKRKNNFDNYAMDMETLAFEETW